MTVSIMCMFHVTWSLILAHIAFENTLISNSPVDAWLSLAVVEPPLSITQHLVGQVTGWPSHTLLVCSGATLFGGKVTYALYILHFSLRLLKRWGSLIVISLGMLLSGQFFQLLSSKPGNIGYPWLVAIFCCLLAVLPSDSLYFTFFLKGRPWFGAVKNLLASEWDHSSIDAF